MHFVEDIGLQHEKSQTVTCFVIEGEPMSRVRFGDEVNRMSLVHCPECSSGVGSLHLLGCTVEQCPLCGDWARDCPCSYERRPQELLRSAA